YGALSWPVELSAKNLATPGLPVVNHRLPCLVLKVVAIAVKDLLLRRLFRLEPLRQGAVVNVDHPPFQVVAGAQRDFPENLRLARKLEVAEDRSPAHVAYQHEPGAGGGRIDILEEELSVDETAHLPRRDLNRQAIEFAIVNMFRHAVDHLPLAD